MIDQAGWGSSKIYADGELSGAYDPIYTIIHWGGYTEERDSLESAAAQLRAWQRYHLNKGWRDIAYNYGVGDYDRGDGYSDIFRLRGENRGGHTAGTDPATGRHWSDVGCGVVWIGGKGDLDGPSDAAKRTMQKFVEERGLLTVLGHQDTGKATQCPGPDWLEWAANFEVGNGELPVPPIGAEPMIEKGHPIAQVVARIQQGLVDWSPDALPVWGVDGIYGDETVRWVGEFQLSQGLPDTGKVDGLTMSLLEVS